MSFNFYQGPHAKPFQGSHVPAFTPTQPLPPKYQPPLPPKFKQAQPKPNVCQPVKSTPYEIAQGAVPYQYGLSTVQPMELKMLKSQHNSILTSALDGTQGVVFGESFTQQKMLNDLKNQ